VNGKLYLVGGIGSDGVVGSVANAYDAGTGQSIELPPMPTARYGASAVGLNGLLYVVGGRNKAHENTGTVEVYNPVTSQWHTLTALPTARSWLGAGVINSRLYAVGGHAVIATGDAELATTQVYTP
ncbi:MAG: kelch repeat-containing protein, partial [Gemmatimonadales bacterium]